MVPSSFPCNPWPLIFSGQVINSFFSISSFRRPSFVHRYYLRSSHCQLLLPVSSLLSILILVTHYIEIVLAIFYPWQSHFSSEF